ncbi:MAG: hypothetical protein EOP50_02300 [Sphingobacteriales bacterium]|nr:MAG: hypothetical protein EOP50_02300 [Sphingobacteriales bacterium]
MKKFLAILTLLAYFTVSTGFVVNLHYCMDRFHSWELGHPAKDRCATCGMKIKKSKGCCHDQVKVVKVQQDVTAAQYAVFAFAAPAIVPVQPLWSFAVPVVETPRPATPIHGPPLISKQDTYLRNCVFRI